MAKVYLTEIVIKKRIREDLGDIDALAKDIEKNGLLNPIVINTNNELVAGYRRYMALQKLNWQAAEVNIIDITDKDKLLEIEISENKLRKNFTIDEIEKYRKKLSISQEKNIFKRILSWFKSLFVRKNKRKKIK